MSIENYNGVSHFSPPEVKKAHGDKVRAEAMQLVAAGFRPIPLRLAGETLTDGKIAKGKEPRDPRWQKGSVPTEEEISEWPDSNVGVVWGEKAGFIDVECDGEAAEIYFREIWKEHANTPTLMYRSSRGWHRIYKFCPSLPGLDKAYYFLNIYKRDEHGRILKDDKGKDITLGHVEIRVGGGGQGAQSVFPPSVHETGFPYEWPQELSPREIQPTDIPLEVAARVQVIFDEGTLSSPTGSRIPESEWARILQGVCNGERNVAAGTIIGRFLREVDITDEAKLDAKFQDLLDWDAKNYNEKGRPFPIGERTLSTHWRNILEKESLRRVSARTESLLKNADTKSYQTISEVKADVAKFARGLPSRISDVELDVIVNNEIEKEDRRVVTAEKDRTVGPDPVAGFVNSGNLWGVTKVLADPEYWEISSPCWPGVLKVDLDELTLGKKLVRAAIGAKGVDLGPKFHITWEGNKHPGLRAKLLSQMKTREGNKEDNRWFQVLTVLWTNHFEDAKTVESITAWNAGNSKKSPCVIKGKLHFKFEHILAPNNWCRDYPKQAEIRDAMFRVGAKLRRPRKGDPERKRCYVLDEQDYEKLKQEMTLTEEGHES